MTFDAFLRDELEKLGWFRSWWLASHDLDPDSFPLEMAPGDWVDQLEAFDCAVDQGEVGPDSASADEEVAPELKVTQALLVALGVVKS